MRILSKKNISFKHKLLDVTLVSPEQLIKQQLLKILECKDRVILLLDGPPAAGKTKYARWLGPLLLQDLGIGVRVLDVDYFLYSKFHRERMKEEEFLRWSYSKNWIDFGKLARVLAAFKRGEETIHLEDIYRRGTTNRITLPPITPKGKFVLIIEGVFVANTLIRKYADLTVYLQADPDLRIGRMLGFRHLERGRSREELEFLNRTVFEPSRVRHESEVLNEVDLVLLGDDNEKRVISWKLGDD